MLQRYCCFLDGVSVMPGISSLFLRRLQNHQKAMAATKNATTPAPMPMPTTAAIETVLGPYLVAESGSDVAVVLWETGKDVFDVE
jgi:hypothetical protein